MIIPNNEGNWVMIHKCHQRRGGTRQQEGTTGREPSSSWWTESSMDYNKILLRGQLSKIYSEIQERDREGKNEEESQQQGVPLTTLPVKSLMSKPWADNQDCGLSHGFISMPILSRNTVLCQGPICSFYAIRTAALIK